ncbi:uncharacterized protein MELLADRAFT_104832 [Melampsora larici-populina 98AG31]|uniref:Uncharacterized protein n=1 Tax=Melampsora larici-populina (strain 98AG31 / pathotype 3-4-7) TaxID=747676 RepID=F4RGC0_MELLP|nr:uncharacterized protein MELLADRAFT_104832 [Melampsora larici-populina 98AG31]EGG08690.1 hypothetical protein MELLADRAFT_104832 [Melampsora larici-populina 98AG31]
MSCDGWRLTLLISMADVSSGFILIWYALKVVLSSLISLALEWFGWVIFVPGSWTSVMTLVDFAFGVCRGGFDFVYDEDFPELVLLLFVGLINALDASRVGVVFPRVLCSFWPESVASSTSMSAGIALKSPSTCQGGTRSDTKDQIAKLNTLFATSSDHPSWASHSHHNSTGTARSFKGYTNSIQIKYKTSSHCYTRSTPYPDTTGEMKSFERT